MSPIDLLAEWNGDLLITANGSVSIAQGWDEVRERIIRNFLTNSAVPLPDGSTTPPDYVFDPLYGLSAGALIDENPTRAWIADFTRRMRQACLSDAAVDPGSVPSIQVTKPAIGTLQVFVSVSLVTGQQNGFSISFVTQPSATTRPSGTGTHTTSPPPPPPPPPTQTLTLSPSGAVDFVIGAAAIEFTCTSNISMMAATLWLVENGVLLTLPGDAALTNNGMELTFSFTPTAAGQISIGVADTTGGGFSPVAIITSTQLTTATSFTLLTPPWAIATQADTVLTGSYAGLPMSLDYTVNNGSAWTTVSSGFVLNNGLFQLPITTPPAGKYAAGVVQIRDTNAPSVSDGTPGAWLVSAFDPSAPSSGTLIYASQIANPNLVSLDGSGAPIAIYDWGGSGQYFEYSPQSPANDIGGDFIGNTLPILNTASGHDGGQTTLKMVPSTNSNEGSYTTVNNFYCSGPLGGPNDALINAVATSAFNTGNWCVVAAFQEQPSPTSNYFGATLVWTQYTGVPSTDTAYLSAGRDHAGSFTTQIYSGQTGGNVLFAPAAVTPTANVWYVLVMVKAGATLKYNLRVSSTLPSYNSLTLSGTGSTTAFAPQYVTWGGGSPADTLNRLTGNSFQENGDIFVVEGTPSAADIEGYVALALSSVGIST